MNLIVSILISRVIMLLFFAAGDECAAMRLIDGFQYEVVDVGDGHDSVFRALSHGLIHSDAHARTLRAEAIAAVSANWEEYHQDTLGPGRRPYPDAAAYGLFTLITIITLGFLR